MLGGRLSGGGMRDDARDGGEEAMSIIRLRLAAMDIAALAGGSAVTFLIRAAARHPELMNARSLATFVGGTLIYATPMVGVSFAAYGLYSVHWASSGPITVTAAVGWACVATVFFVAFAGPADAPVLTALPGFVVLSSALVLVREVARRSYALRRV
jgi:hypothetical protein